MKTLGRHLIAELYGCDRRLLDDAGRLERLLIAAARHIGATVLGHTFHKFEPQGVSGTVVICESHLSIHTWPQHGYVTVDLHTCGALDPRPACDFLAAALACGERRVQEIERGVAAEVEGDRRLGPGDVVVETRWVTSPAGSC